MSVLITVIPTNVSTVLDSVLVNQFNPQHGDMLLQYHFSIAIAIYQCIWGDVVALGGINVKYKAAVY